LTHPVRLSALAALDIQRAREWHDAREPGLGDQFLQRVNETMARIGCQIPTSADHLQEWHLHCRRTHPADAHSRSPSAM